LTVSIAHVAPIVVRAVELEGGGQLDIGPKGMTLAPEEIEPVVVPSGKTERGSNCIPRERAWFRGVHATKIKSELIVDEYEHIIVTKEVEGFTSIVGKSSVSFVTEMEVVVISIESYVLVVA